jgi:hypothetical protein
MERSVGSLRVAANGRSVQCEVHNLRAGLLVVSEDLDGKADEFALELSWETTPDSEHQLNGDLLLRPFEVALEDSVGKQFLVGGETEDSSARIYYYEHWYVPAKLEILSLESNLLRARITYMHEDGLTEKASVEGWFYRGDQSAA